MNAVLEKPLVSGARQTLRALREGRAVRVYIAEDAATQVVEPVRAAADEAEIPVCSIRTMRELGRACGLGVGCACAASLRPEG